ncbi:hypothetical protein [Cellulomonas xiejunii]|uniref:hypothetical protein n=1 Tax=Cellulomonas xiejunii TaxID=2968083 RepID=UPI001D0EFE76|nr:hypothetical protein [Cellulomonas xiejunii]MCC2314154.1 hypothetical protein [Cellulomonas xiejunii]
MVTPAVVWEGSPPSGELEDDPWVRTMREGFVALAAATNSVNYVDGDISTTWREDIVLRAADLARSQLANGNAVVVLGPRPFTPVEVTVDDDGQTAEVAVCIGSSTVVEERPSQEAEGREAMIYGLRLGEDGYRRITGTRQPERGHTLVDGGQFHDEYCQAVPLGRALFDPAPELAPLLNLDGDDVVAPPSPSPTFAVEVPT